MVDEVAAAFDGLGCEVGLLVQPLRGSGEVAVAAEQPVVAASVFKVLVALVVESRFALGRLDPWERVVLPAARRTPGPVGFSLFADDVQVSLRDLVTAMLTISDNVATDTLIERVGVQALNAAAAELGLDHTHVVSDLRTLLDSIGRDAGFGDYVTLAAWEPDHPEDPALAEVQQRVLRSAALDPARTTRTTPRDMVRLLRGIWTDQAGPPQACARVRDLMAHQLTRHRLASGFHPPVRVAAKSGGLLGVIRNEVGVIDYPDGQSYLAAVFTRAGQPNGGEVAINTAIGRAAAAAVAALRHQDTVASLSLIHI
jgi:beta-lactamase class A